MINNLEDIISHSMAFIEDDYTELWVIANKVFEENSGMNFFELVEAIKTVIKELVENYNVLLLDEETQKPLNLETKDILKAVENRLNYLKRMPNIGDGIWFTIQEQRPE
jgi:hypothetical protein